MFVLGSTKTVRHIFFTLRRRIMESPSAGIQLAFLPSVPVSAD
jgi:hypothetical protein